QGATIPAEKVTVNGDKLRADFPRVNGFYEGTINQAATETTGTWTQNGTLPLIFKRADSSAKSAETKSEAKPASGEKPFTSPIDVSVSIPRTSFQADGKTHLAYELHIVNFNSLHTTLSQIEVLSDTGAELERSGQTELIADLLPVGNREATGTDKLNIGLGQILVVYMWVTLDGATKLPTALEHKITVKV